NKKLTFEKKIFSITTSEGREKYRKKIKENTEKNSIIGRSKSVTFLNSKNNSKEIDNNNKKPKIYKARSAIKSLNSLIVAVERSRQRTFDKEFINKHQNSFDSNSDSEEEVKYQINSFKNAFYITNDDDNIKILLQIGEDTLRICKPFINGKNFSINDIKNGNELAFVNTEEILNDNYNVLEEIKLSTFTITSIDQSPDCSILAIGIKSESSGSSIVIKNSQTLKDICIIPLKNICDHVKLSQHNENVCSLSRLIMYEKNKIEKILLNITIYSIQYSTLLTDTCVFNENDIGEYIDISFCPVDESILFLLTNNGAYFLRLQNNVITILSSIELVNIVSHSWVSDTYIAIGSNDGKLFLYRETTPLKLINIKSIECEILKSYLYNDNEDMLGIRYITSNIYKIIVYLQIGIILIFDNIHDIQKLFEKCKIIVINDRTNELIENNIPYDCLGIKLDFNACNMLFINKKGVYTTNILYSDVITEKEMRIVVGQNCSSITNLDIIEMNKNNKREILVSLDDDNNIICTELYSKQILSIKNFFNNKIIGFCSFQFGYQILIANNDGIYMYDLIYLDIKKRNEQKILDGKASIIVSNYDKTYAAIIIESSLYILNLYTLNIICNCNLNLKKRKKNNLDCEIICCKWNDNNNLFPFQPSSLGILTKNENILFIEGRCGKLLWSITTKLKFFIDICLGNDDIVYALNKKYLVTCYKEGQEIKTISIPTYHSVGTHVYTKFIEILNDDLYIGDNMGIINVLINQTKNDKKFIKRKVIKSIKYNYTGGTDDKNKQIFLSCMKINKISNILLLGYSNGFVIKISLNNTNIILQSDIFNIKSRKNTLSKELILYPINKIQNLQDLVSHLSFERNSIIKGSKQILDEYIKIKEKELIDTTTLLNNTIKNLKEKIKICEKEYINKLDDKEEIIGTLKKNHKNEIDSIKNFYENMINDHLRQVIKMKNDYNEEINNIKNSYEKKINDCRKEINDLNNEYKLKINNEKNEKNVLKDKIKYLDDEVFDLCKRIDQTEQKLEKQIQQEKTEKLKLKENFEITIKDIKATLVILNDEKDGLLDTTAMGRMEIQLLKEEIMEKNEKINEYEGSLIGMEKQLEDKSKDLQEKIKHINILIRKIHLLEKEVQKEKKERINIEKHMIEFETKIEDMSRNVYNEHKLQHNALSLIGMYNTFKPKSSKTKLNLMKN
uniref:Uncharacterized protein n=1 Tax=Strongyloides stercoralis TaxID=6248 RepID=A0AAF5DQD6_STRER